MKAYGKPRSQYIPYEDGEERVGYVGGVPGKKSFAIYKYSRPRKNTRTEYARAWRKRARRLLREFN
jgi:hypothetical protein